MSLFETFALAATLFFGPVILLAALYVIGRITGLVKEGQ